MRISIEETTTNIVVKDVPIPSYWKHKTLDKWVFIQTENTNIHLYNSGIGNIEMVLSSWRSPFGGNSSWEECTKEEFEGILKSYYEIIVNKLA